MNVVSRVVADRLVQEIHPGNVRCVLDLGGASGNVDPGLVESGAGITRRHL